MVWIALIGGLLWGAGIGYALCRRMLHEICKNEVGPYATANIFGYPSPPKPTIEELEEILRGA